MTEKRKLADVIENSQMKSSVGQFNWASAAAMSGHSKLSRPSVDFNQAWIKNCSGLFPSTMQQLPTQPANKMVYCFICGNPTCNSTLIYSRQPADKPATPFFPFMEYHDPAPLAEPMRNWSVKSCFVCQAFLVQQWKSFERKDRYTPINKRLYWLKRPSGCEIRQPVSQIELEEMLSENMRENHFHSSAVQNTLPIDKSALLNNTSPPNEVDHTPPRSRSSTSSPPAEIKNDDVSSPTPRGNTPAANECDADVKKELGSNHSDDSVGEKETDVVCQEGKEAADVDENNANEDVKEVPKEVPAKTSDTETSNKPTQKPATLFQLALANCYSCGEAKQMNLEVVRVHVRPSYEQIRCGVPYYPSCLKGKMHEMAKLEHESITFLCIDCLPKHPPVWHEMQKSFMEKFTSCSVLPRIPLAEVVPCYLCPSQVCTKLNTNLLHLASASRSDVIKEHLRSKQMSAGAVPLDFTFTYLCDPCLAEVRQKFVNGEHSAEEGGK